MGCRVNREPNFEGGRELGDDPARDAFDAIVASWQAEGHVPQWPADTPPLDGPLRELAPPAETLSSPFDTGFFDTGFDTGPLEIAPPELEALDTAPLDAATRADAASDIGSDAAPLHIGPDDPPTRPHRAVRAAAADDHHFVPPEPPPIPRMGPPAVVGAVLLGMGLLLVITPAWLGMSDIYGLPLGLIALAAGLGWLVLRLWPDSASAPDRDDDTNDGAVL